LSISVSGNRLVDGQCRTIQLRGVNRSGTEDACAQGWSIFAGPSDDASVAAIAAWHANVVRVPLNEACWLDLKSQINPYNASYVGQNYRAAIVKYVGLLHAHGLYAILELHWNGTDTSLANWQHPMPDAAQSPAFWASVAATFRDDHAVLFDLFNEPSWNDWQCWAAGCTVWPGTKGAYRSAGMVQLVAAVRKTGARQPILLGGTHYATDLSQWLAGAPDDPAHALVASVHIYDYECKTMQCFRGSATYAALGPIAEKVPIVIGELGEKDCGGGFVAPMMTWADQEGYSYLGWAWDVASCTGFPSLITNYNGTPTPFGAAFQKHFAAVKPHS
jgi:hypothetical protein